jgi:hypothetical protein
MMGVAQARKLARFRDSERRAGAAGVAAADDAVGAAKARAEQIFALASAVAAGSGEIGGAGLAARGEFVARLLTGQIATVAQRDAHAVKAEGARRLFGLADARAGFAKRCLAGAERLESRAAEQRAALKTPFRRMDK